MNTALLIVGVFILLVVAAAIAEAYFKRSKHRTLSNSQPQNVVKHALGQDGTTTSIIQDMLDNRQRQKMAQLHKETHK